MEAENTQNTFFQVYNAGESEVLPEHIGHLLCIFVQRGILVAGFDSNKDLITIRYRGYSTDTVVWDFDFFQNAIASEPLLAEPVNTRAVFVLSDKNMIIPNDLYKETHAKAWLRKIHFVEKDDVIDSYTLEQEKAYYLLAMPSKIKELIAGTFGKVPVLPLSIYQFSNTPRIGLALQCTVTAEQACVTLHIDGNLLWHNVFNYSAAEDIVFEGKYLCKENNYFATKLTILFNSLTANEFGVLSEYSQYYPAMKSGEGNRIHTSWDAPIALLNQLLSCAL